MNKLYFVMLSIFLVAACENKNNDSANIRDTTTVESLGEDSITQQESLQSEASLSEKGALIAKGWKALEFETPTAKLTSELVDISFDFKENGQFEYSEDGKKENGDWKLNEDETTLLLQFSDNNKADFTIKELGDDKMVLTGKAYGMNRTYVLAPL